VSRVVVAPERLAFFRNRVFYWLDKFGLGEWRVKVMIDEDLDSGLAGRCGIRTTARVAEIVLGGWLPDYEVDDAHLDWTALHEVLELAIWPVQRADENDAGEGHQLIHRIMRALGQFDPNREDQ
jgi:hypothetical protein